MCILAVNVYIYFWKDVVYILLFIFLFETWRANLIVAFDISLIYKANKETNL